MPKKASAEMRSRVAVASSTLPRKGILSGKNSNTPKVGLIKYKRANVPTMTTKVF